jgi:hypothetical protein
MQYILVICNEKYFFKHLVNANKNEKLPTDKPYIMQLAQSVCLAGCRPTNAISLVPLTSSAKVYIILHGEVRILSFYVIGPAYLFYKLRFRKFRENHS